MKQKRPVFCCGSCRREYTRVGGSENEVEIEPTQVIKVRYVAKSASGFVTLSRDYVMLRVTRAFKGG